MRSFRFKTSLYLFFASLGALAMQIFVWLRDGFSSVLNLHSIFPYAEMNTGWIGVDQIIGFSLELPLFLCLMGVGYFFAD